MNFSRVFQQRRSKIGFSLFLILSVVGLAHVIRIGHFGHWEIFEYGARELWAGRNPYEQAFPSGWWFYSPFCGLAVFGPFAWLPHRAGAAIFAVVSIFVFAWGSHRSLKSFLPTQRTAHQVYWALVASEVLGNLQNVRLELLSLGIFLAALPLARDLRRAWVFEIALALLCNWKFQFLPVAGLYLAGLWLEKRSTRSIAIFVGSLVASFCLPALWLGWNNLVGMHESWNQKLSEYTQGTWPNFLHLWKFVDRLVGFHPAYETLRLWLVGLGAATAALHLILIRRRGISSTSPEALLQASALGLMYTLCFSPLSQGAAYLLAAPIVLFWIHGWTQAKGTDTRRILREALLFWALVSWLSSDLAPNALKIHAGERAWKALGPLFLCSPALLYHQVAGSWLSRSARSRTDA